MLDWAAANGKISPLEYLRRVEAATEDLGITREEMDREAGRYTVQDAVDAMIADYLPPYSPLTGRLASTGVLAAAALRPLRVRLPGPHPGSLPLRHPLDPAPLTP